MNPIEDTTPVREARERARKRKEEAETPAFFNTIVNWGAEKILVRHVAQQVSNLCIHVSE